MSTSDTVLAPNNEIGTQNTPTQSQSDTAQSRLDRSTSQSGKRESAADRFMRWLLRAPVRDRSAEQTVESERIAHRGFRISMVVSGVRCLITYLLIPILVPIVSFADVFSAPIGIALCLVAFVSGIVSVRRFWISNHRSKWMYTGFIAIVFIILTIAVAFDIAGLVG